MGLRQIKAAVNKLENEGSARDQRRLVLAVPLKRGVADRKEAIRGIARGQGTSIATVTKNTQGWVLGVLVRAELYDSYPMEGDLVLLGNGTYEHSGEIIYPSPDDLRWNEASIIDDNFELQSLDRWEEVTDAILYESRPQRGIYYSRQSRY